MCRVMGIMYSSSCSRFPLVCTKLPRYCTGQSVGDDGMSFVTQLGIACL